jgi:hypothetical protein
MGPACNSPCTIKVSFLGLFLTLIFGHLPFSFDPLPPWKRWVSCWLVGPACHPLCTINFFFLLISSRIWNVETAAAKWDPHVILYAQ